MMKRFDASVTLLLWIREKSFLQIFKIVLMLFVATFFLFFFYKKMLIRPCCIHDKSKLCTSRKNLNVKDSITI